MQRGDDLEVVPDDLHLAGRRRGLPTTGPAGGDADEHQSAHAAVDVEALAAALLEDDALAHPRLQHEWTERVRDADDDMGSFPLFVHVTLPPTSTRTVAGESAESVTVTVAVDAAPTEPARSFPTRDARSTARLMVASLHRISAVDAWLTRTRDALADAAGVAPASLDLSAADTETILELARIAAHDSGERTNAPLLCYLVGRVTAGGASLDELADAVRKSSS